LAEKVSSDVRLESPRLPLLGQGRLSALDKMEDATNALLYLLAAGCHVHSNIPTPFLLNYTIAVNVVHNIMKTERKYRYDAAGNQLVKAYTVKEIF